MQVPPLSNIPRTNSAHKCFNNLPVGIRKNSKDYSLEIELCSFEISDTSKIKKLSIWHCFSKQLAVLGTDMLILEGEEIQASSELDYLLGTTRCLGDINKPGIAYFLDSKKKAYLDVSNILLTIHKISPAYLSRRSLCDIKPKIEAFINIPSVRGLKKMQVEAEYLYKGSVLGSTFSDFLHLLFSNSLQLEKCSLPELKKLATHDIKSYKEKMSSPREGISHELTDTCKFMEEHEKRLINHIERIARKRLFWGCNEKDFLAGDVRYRRTMSYILGNVIEVGIVQQMAAFDL